MFFGNFHSLDMDAIEELDLGGPIVGTKERTKLGVLLNEPGAFVCLEDWPSKAESNWAFWHDEIHIVLGGTADLSYTLPPNHVTVRQRSCQEGDTYLILNGTRARWQVTSDEPYRHLCVVMPRYEYDRRLLKDEL